MPFDFETAIIIPAFNEQDWIGRTIDLVRAAGIQARVIVVNDGSTDRTAEIAREKGVEVISLPKNFGKANAFFTGLKAALLKNPKAIVTLDADMTAVPKEALERLIAPARKASFERKQLMVVADILEGDRENPATIYSGIRAFSNPAAFALRQFSKKKLARGYSLESFLNTFFTGSESIIHGKNSIFLNNSGFKARAAIECYKRRQRQFRDIIGFSFKNEKQVRKKRFPEPPTQLVKNPVPKKR